MFPFVTCDITGYSRPAYAICAHILHGAPIAEIRHAHNDEMGMVMCMICARKQQTENELTGREFELICADCVERTMLSPIKVGSA